jgi:drug/metabolite transporter (DMT)-like permease
MPDALLQPVFVLLWSSGYVVGELASEVSGPVPLLATRFILASLVTVPLALRTGLVRRAPLGRLAVIGLLFQVTQFGGIYGGFALGVPAGLSALVMLGLSPLVTTGLAIAGGQESSDWRVWSGLIVGIAGVVIGLTPELGHARIGAGLILTTVGMLGLAGGSVLQKRWGAGVDPKVSAAAQSVTGAAVMAPILLISGGRYHVGVQLVLALSWLGVGMGMGTLLVLVNLLARQPASRVSALLLLVPAVTAIASVPALGEPLHVATLAGMAVSASGVWIAIRGDGRPAPRRSRWGRHPAAAHSRSA